MYTHCYRLGRLEPAGWRSVRALHNRAHVNLATSHATVDLLAQHGIERLAHAYASADVRLQPSRPARLARGVG